MASRGASLFAFFFCNEKKKGGFGAPPQELLHKPKGGAKGLTFGKWFALLNRHLPPVVKSKKRPNVEKCCPLNANKGKNVIFPLVR